eukprot:365119-Chlamydomonas_euryale.AAC.9
MREDASASRAPTLPMPFGRLCDQIATPASSCDSYCTPLRLVWGMGTAQGSSEGQLQHLCATPAARSRCALAEGSAVKDDLQSSYSVVVECGGVIDATCL